MSITSNLATWDPHRVQGVVREARRAVSLTAFAVLENGATFPLTIVDLSYDGCRIEAPVALLPGLPIKISVERLGVIAARVRWSAGGLAGLQFRAPTQPDGNEKPRNHPRHAVAAEALLRRAGQKGYRARVRDLTRKGCKIEFVERPRLGETLWAKFDGLEALEARARWIDGPWGGLEFERPIYPAVFELLLARIGQTT